MADRIIPKIGESSDARGQADLPGVAITLIVAGTVLFVGLQVMSQVIEQTALTENDSLYNASEAIQSGLNDAFGLFGVAFLVVILSVIIVYLYGLRGRQ